MSHPISEAKASVSLLSFLVAHLGDPRMVGGNRDGITVPRAVKQGRVKTSSHCPAVVSIGDASGVAATATL